ncbi:MAG: hypothetical protein N3A66_00940 [Planctomycetota bacterium]|nr:hypothetical protein [Planctomycetota bacterium]
MYCWYRRWRLETAVDDGRLLSAEEERHLAVCADCRHHYDNLLALSQRLRQAAAALTAEPSAHFVARTLAAVRRRQRHRRPALMLWPIYASLAVCLVLLLAWAAIFFTGPGSGSGRVESKPPATAVVALNDAASKAVAIAGASDVEKLEPLLAAPLSSEMERLRRDMLAAARFVAACLPVAFENGKGREDGI